MRYNLKNATGEIVNTIEVDDTFPARKAAAMERYELDLRKWRNEMAAWQVEYEAAKALMEQEKARDHAAAMRRFEVASAKGDIAEAIKAHDKAREIERLPRPIKCRPAPAEPDLPPEALMGEYVLPEGHTLELAEG